jgi:hypothetical protein
VSIPAHQLAVLAEHVECALETGRSYIEVPTVVLAALLAPPAAPLVLTPPPERDYQYLCCACGAIRPHSTWTFWKREPEEGDTWIPSERGDTDPMCRCPECGWEHVDDDSSPGLYDGTLEEMIVERTTLVAGGDEFDLTDYRPAEVPV